MDTMIPAVPPPKKLLGRSIDFKLKPGWRYDETRGVFVSPRGVEFAPPRLPKNSSVHFKVPSLARSTANELSPAERDLQRYMQVILPSSRALQKVMKSIKAVPGVEAVSLAPEISLPITTSAKQSTARKKR
jgi:hypothetical protein